MTRTLITEIYKNSAAFDGKEITLSGWAKTVRASNVFGFIELSDGSCFKNCQVVFEKQNLDNYDEIARQNVGCALTVTGSLILTPQNRQPFELKALSITVEGSSTPDFPLQKKRHSLEFLREIAHLRPRANLFSAVFKVRSEAAFAIHSFFNSKNFVYVHTPIITGSDCEGAGAMFSVTSFDLAKPNSDFKRDFFEKHASLTVSGQLNGEAYAMAFSNIYTFGPTFRAERSNTARHAAEFWMIEPEMAFCDLCGNMDIAEQMVKFIIAHIIKTCAQELEFLNEFVDKGLISRLNAVNGGSFERLSYTEAIKILDKSKKEFEYPVYWGCDLQSEHERYLTEEVFKKPVFLTDYPKEIKAFYMRVNDDNKTVAAMDLLVPSIGELIGGSQREERLEVLKNRMIELSLNPNDYWWYLDLRRYGGNKHAGFGLGFERMIMYLTGVSNIRDVIPFPRTVGNLEF